MKTRIEEALRRRHRKGDEGFTLVELLVVILIIAILAVVGIIALLAALSAGRESASKTAARTAITAVQAARTGEGTTTFAFLTADAVGTMSAADPDITWVAAGDTPGGGQNSVSINAADANNVYIASATDSGDCFYVHMSTTTGTQYASAAGGTCTGTAAASATYTSDQNAGWSL